MKKTAVILMNIGTPARADLSSVRRYLREFLSDPYVLDIHYFLRFLLVNLVIVPFRAPKSLRLYQKIWTPGGSPVMVNMNRLVSGLNERLPSEYRCFPAMRYGNPSVKTVLNQISNQTFDRILVVPLFPQYASSTNGSAIDHVKKHCLKTGARYELRFVEQFYRDEGYLDSWTRSIKNASPQSFDHLVFSYHGLPDRQIRNIHPEIDHASCECIRRMPAYGHRCYKACCYETTRLIAGRLHLRQENYTTAFQSRISDRWITPFTDRVISRLAEQGKKRVLIIAPGFVSDCLETLMELGVEYRDLFLSAGGEELVLVRSLNDQAHWITALSDLIRSQY